MNDNSPSQEVVDRWNTITYSNNGTSRSSVALYTCALCNKPTCIDDSFSNKGKNLVCCNCFRTHFRHNSSMMMKWIMSNDFENKHQESL